MVDTADYSVVQAYDDFEVRRYPKMLVGRVEGLPDDRAFSILFQYIAGGNRPRKKIAMTAPVISQGPTQQIEMTSPVISDDSSFAFIMPSEYTLESIPEPVDDRITIAEMPERTVAVRSFNGRAGKKEVGRNLDELLRSVDRAGMKVDGMPFLMRYNSPFMPGFLRRNEIGIEVKISEF